MSARRGFRIISIIISLVVIPTFAIFSFSQSNNTLSSDLSSDTTLSNASIPDESNDDTPIENETSFASLSRSLAETNQSDDEQTSFPPSTESDSEGETSEEEEEEEDIQ